MAAEKYGCFVRAKTAHYSVFTSLKGIKTKQNKNTKNSCLKVSKLIYHADVLKKKDFFKKILPKECMQNKRKSTC